MPALLEAVGLVKRLSGRLVVDGVDLVCHSGQVLAALVPLDMRLLRKRVLGD